VNTFVPSPSEGSFNIAGADVTQTINFTSPTEPTFTLTFTETGLPTLTNWSVTLNGILETSTSATVVFTEPNGTFDFSAAAPGYTGTPANGEATVAGANYTQTIDFGAATGPFSVTFTETGLVSGTSWSVTLEGVVMSSTTDSIVFAEPDGSYAFTVSPVSGYYAPNPATGEISVSGASPATTNIVFTPTTAQTFSVIFTESGLATGTSWSVTLNGVTTPSTTTSLSFVEPNGTYGYTIGSVSGYHSDIALGSAVVAGANVSVTLVFTAVTPVTFSVTFTESGLSTGTSWTVTLAGAPKSGQAGGDIVFSGLANDSYAYTVSAVSGYTSSPTSSSVTVDGNSPTVAVTFTATGPSPSPSGGSGGLSSLDWGLIAAVFLAALLVLFFILAGRRRKKDDKSQLPPTISPSPPPPPPGKTP
jgi:hypothetical protein